MTEDRKPFWPWIVALLIGLPVMYVASFGPACWITSHLDDPHSVFDTVYKPLCDSGYAIGGPVWASLIKYGRLGMSPGTSLSIPRDPGERNFNDAVIWK